MTSVEPESSARRCQRLLFLLAVGVVLSILFGHAVPADRVLVTYDATHLYVPVKTFTADALRSGRLPTWTADVGCGVPFLANPMTQVFYPGNVLFLALRPIDALKVFLLLHLFLTAVAFVRLTRTYEVRGPAASVGALCFVASGAFVSFHWNPLWIAGWPWILFALAATRRILHDMPTRRMAASLGVCLALTALAGAFELLVAYACWSVAEWIASSTAPALLRVRGAEVGHDLRDATPRWSTRLALLAAAGAIAVLLGACQLLPTWEFLQLGSRATGISESKALHWSLAPQRILELLVHPQLMELASGGGGRADVFGAATSLVKGVYVGVAVIGFALIGCFAARRGDRLLLVGALFVTLLMALGDTTPLMAWLRGVVPGAGSFRYPVKMVVVAMLPLCLLAALGVQRLLDLPAGAAGQVSRRPPGWPMWTATVLLAGAAALRLFREPLFDWISSHGNSLQADTDLVTRSLALVLMQGAVFLLAIALFVRVRAKIPMTVAVGVLLLAALDLAVANRHLVVTGDVATLGPPLPLPPPAAFDDSAGHRRIASRLTPGKHRYLFPPYLASFQGYRSLHDYGAMELRHGSRFRASFQRHPDRLYAMTASRVVLADRGAGMISVDSNGAALPRASLVTRAIVAAEPEAAAWYVDSDDFDPRREVVLEGAPPTFAERGALPRDAATEKEALGAVHVLRDVHDEVRIDVVARREAFLVLADSWYPGWQAYLDGEPVPHYRANVAFRAVALEPGRHDVVFRYRPPAVFWGVMITLIALIGTTLFAFAGSRSGGASRPGAGRKVSRSATRRRASVAIATASDR